MSIRTIYGNKLNAKANIRILLSCQVWWCMPIIPAFRRWRQEKPKFQASLGYIFRDCLKKKKKKKKWVQVLAQVIDCLPSKPEALGISPSTTKQKKLSPIKICKNAK
jgi:hypothetical protein